MRRTEDAYATPEAAAPVRSDRAIPNAPSLSPDIVAAYVREGRRLRAVAVLNALGAGDAAATSEAPGR